MEPVLGLFPNQRMRRFDRLIGDFLATMRRQAVENINRIMSQCKKLPVHLIPLKNFIAIDAPFTASLTRTCHRF